MLRYTPRSEFRGSLWRSGDLAADLLELGSVRRFVESDWPIRTVRFNRRIFVRLPITSRDPAVFFKVQSCLL
jgi:hypothetical protein